MIYIGERLRIDKCPSMGAHGYVVERLKTKTINRNGRRFTCEEWTTVERYFTLRAAVVDIMEQQLYNSITNETTLETIVYAIDDARNRIISEIER